MIFDRIPAKMFDSKIATVILVGVFVHRALTGSQPNGAYDFSEEKLVTLMKKCQNDTNASDDDMVYLVTDKVPETKTQACLVACFGIKADLMRENGTAIVPAFLNITAATKTPPPSMTKEVLLEKTNEVLVFCNKNVTVPDTKENHEKCEAFRLYFVCFDKKAKQIGLPLDQ